MRKMIGVLAVYGFVVFNSGCGGSTVVGSVLDATQKSCREACVLNGTIGTKTTEQCVKECATPSKNTPTASK